MSNKEVFATRLKELIGQQNVCTIAASLGIAPQTLYRYLRAEREIGLDNLIVIADFFGVDLDYLTGRTN